MIRNLILAMIASAAVCGGARAVPLCADASRKWLDYVEGSPAHVLELDSQSCKQQIIILDQIIDCADNYVDEKHPVYYQSVALSACVRQRQDAHYYNGVAGKPYPAHAPVDIAHTDAP